MKKHNQNHGLIYGIVVFLSLFFTQCNSHNDEKEIADRNAFGMLMDKFPQVGLPLDYTVGGNFVQDNNILQDTVTYTKRMIDYTVALRFFCRGDKQWGNDIYYPAQQPSFAGDVRLPDKSDQRILIYTRTVGDLLNDDSCATYVTLSTFLPGGTMCDKVIIGGADPSAYFESHIDSAYNIYVSKIIFRDNPTKIVYKDTILCKVVHDNYTINSGGEILKTKEFISHALYYFDSDKEGQFTKLESK